MLQEKFEEIKDCLLAEGRTDLAEFIDERVAIIKKKNSYKSTAPTKTQKENEVLKEEVVSILTTTPASVDEIIAKMSGGSYSVQKMSALLGQLVNEGKANRTYVKRHAYFTSV